MRFPLQRTMLVVGCCLVAGPVLAQDRDRTVVPPPSLSGEISRPTSLPRSSTSPSMLENPGGSGNRLGLQRSPFTSTEGSGTHSEVRDLTPAFIPGRNEPVSEVHHTTEIEGGVYTFADLLFMRPRRQATDFAIVDGSNDLLPRGKTENLQFDPRIGFRVGLGYVMNNGWSAGVSYTYFRSADQRIANAPATGVVYPTLTRPGLVDVATRSVGNLGLEYNVLDFDVMKQHQLDESFILKVGAGAKMASIKQDLSAVYNGLDANVAQVTNRLDFFGTGPTFGSELHWLSEGGFGLYGKGNVGMLVGNFKTGLTETNNQGATVHADLQDKFIRVIPVMTVGLGLQYRGKAFMASAGYEVTNYFNLIQRPQFIDDFSEGKFSVQSGDLSLDGLVFRLGWQY
jgi:hypothetical protein